MHFSPRLPPMLGRLFPFFATVALYPSIWHSIAYEWLTFEQDNSHALPAFLSALFIAINTKKIPNSNFSKMTQIILVVSLILLSVAAQIFQVVNIQLLNYLILFITLFILLVWVYGTNAIESVVSISILTLLSFPFLDSLIEPLVQLASLITSFTLEQFQITAFIEGNIISIPYGKITIAEGCSGIRYLLISIVLACLVSNVNNYNLKMTILTIAIATIGGLLINWIRIIILVMVGYVTEMDSSLMRDHEVFGWVVFCCIAFPLIYWAPHNTIKSTNSLFQEINLKSNKIIVVILVLLAIFNFSSIYIFRNSLIENAAHASVKTLDTSSKSKLPVVLENTPMHPSEPSTIYKYGDIYIELHSNQKESMEEKLVTYNSQLTISNRWIHHEDLSVMVKSERYTASIFTSTSQALSLIKLQAFNVGNFWSSSYSNAKLLQIPALLSGHNYYNQYQFSAICKYNSCQQEIAEIIEILQEIKKL